MEDAANDAGETVNFEQLTATIEIDGFEDALSSRGRWCTKISMEIL